MRLGRPSPAWPTCAATAPRRPCSGRAVWWRPVPRRRLPHGRVPAGRCHAQLRHGGFDASPAAAPHTPGGGPPTTLVQIAAPKHAKMLDRIGNNQDVPRHNAEEGVPGSVFPQSQPDGLSGCRPSAGPSTSRTPQQTLDRIGRNQDGRAPTRRAEPRHAETWSRRSHGGWRRAGASLGPSRPHTHASPASVENT